jgi:DNA-binding transcriptional LysR family regulator
MGFVARSWYHSGRCGFRTGGVAWLPDWLIEEALETGRLLRLLPDRPARLHDIHLLWPKATVVPARLQVAITALTGASELWPS